MFAWLIYIPFSFSIVTHPRSYLFTLTSFNTQVEVIISIAAHPPETTPPESGMVLRHLPQCPEPEANSMLESQIRWCTCQEVQGA
jgi:hypothetical protein